MYGVAIKCGVCGKVAVIDRETRDDEMFPFGWLRISSANGTKTQDACSEACAMSIFAKVTADGGE
jgi:hypothetical protein